MQMFSLTVALYIVAFVCYQKKMTISMHNCVEKRESLFGQPPT